MAKFLDRINSPADLKKIDTADLPALSKELREEIISVIAKNGGHLGASLGTVELTVALHYVLNTPKDRIVWDTGHNAHSHKILTGRRERFHTVRQQGGISTFPSRKESPYDTFGVGHASTSISAALGMAVARDIAGKRHRVAAVIGDGGLTGGIAFEGINNAGILKSDILVVLNDNKMSIARNVGALSTYLTKVTSGRIYNRMESDVWELLGLIPKLGGKAQKVAHRIKESIKGLVVPGLIFEELGFRYFGPVDGHNVEFLVETLKDLKKLKGPILLHVITEKGKGIDDAAKDSQRFHAVGSFDKVPGDKPKKTAGPPSYTKVFGDSLITLAEENKKVIGITAAMPDGTGLTAFGQLFPTRFYDVGIAEQHAVTFAAGLATEGMIPVAAIYSTFLQRAYDQVVHDVGLQNLPVRFVMDRAGYVGEDGPTHHGIFDISYLRAVPNFVLMAPKDENELQHMLKTMVEYNDGPSAIRIPRGTGIGVPIDTKLHSVPIGRAEVLREGRDLVFLAYGTCVSRAMDAAEMLDKEKIDCTVVNARFAKPLDTELLESYLEHEPLIITVEENVRSGGFGSAVLEYLMEKGYDAQRIQVIAAPDEFIEHAPQTVIWSDVGLDADSFASAAIDMVRSTKGILKSFTPRSA